MLIRSIHMNSLQRQDLPEQKIAKPQEMKADLNVFLGVPCPYVVWRVMILRSHGKDSEENSKPGSRDGLRLWPLLSDEPCSLFKIDHQTRFKIINVYHKTPKGMGDFFVSLEKPCADCQFLVLGL